VKKLERRTLHSLSTIGERSLFTTILQTPWAYLVFLRRMGLVQDATVLASSGYAKTSSALSLLSKMGNEKENLGERATIEIRECRDTDDIPSILIEQSGKRSVAVSAD